MESRVWPQAKMTPRKTTANSCTKTKTHKWGEKKINKKREQVARQQCRRKEYGISKVSECKSWAAIISSGPARVCRGRGWPDYGHCLDRNV